MSEVGKIVLDTNILVSSLWTESGNASAIIKLMPRFVLPYHNAQILSEYAEVLSRPKFSFTADKRESLLSVIRLFGVEFLPNKSAEVMIDEDDRIFYDTAKDSGSILITGNVKHYPTKPFIMTPSDYLLRFSKTSEEILGDSKKAKQLRHLRYIDSKLDESERLAADPNAEWIDEDDFWKETDSD